MITCQTETDAISRAHAMWLFLQPAARSPSQLDQLDPSIAPVVLANATAAPAASNGTSARGVRPAIGTASASLLGGAAPVAAPSPPPQESRFATSDEACIACADAGFMVCRYGNCSYSQQDAADRSEARKFCWCYHDVGHMPPNQWADEVSRLPPEERIDPNPVDGSAPPDPDYYTVGHQQDEPDASSWEARDNWVHGSPNRTALAQTTSITAYICCWANIDGGAGGGVFGGGDNGGDSCPDEYPSGYLKCPEHYKPAGTPGAGPLDPPWPPER